jgi:hypothetical protein
LRTAAPAERRAYWTVYNRRRPPRERTLDAVVGELFPQGPRAELQRRGRVAAALEALLPPELAGEIEVGSGRGGRWTLLVSSGALAYRLRRHLTEQVISRLAGLVPELGLRSLRVEVGRPPAGRNAALLL